MNKQIEKVIYILIDSIVFLALAAFIYFNIGQEVTFTCPIMQKVYTSPLIFLILAIFVLAYLGGIAACGLIKSKTDELCNAYQKRHESISISKDTDTARIATLEAKIQTLEAALESALKNKE